jgi:hypothetical protein
MAPRRLFVLLIGTIAALVLPAAPALAHGRGSDATNFNATVRAAPDVPGLSFRVYGSDEYLAVTNTSGQEVVVHGYEDEPYLRIGPDGVFENRRSPAAYLNAERYGQVPLPADADSTAEPDWVRVSGGDTWLWHDHRIHWMSLEPPAAVLADPGSPHVVYPEWSVPVSVGGQEGAVTGDLRWVPAPSPWPWLAAGLVATLPALAGLRTQPVGDDRWPGLVRPAAVVLGILAVANLVHLADDLLAVPLPLPTILLAAGQTALFLLIAAFGALRAWQGREGAFTALGVGASALLVGQGLLYLGVLTTSQTASIFPDAVTKGVVALSLAQALPLGIVTVLGTRRLLPPLEDDEDDPVAIPHAARAASSPGP